MNDGRGSCQSTLPAFGFSTWMTYAGRSTYSWT